MVSLLSSCPLASEREREAVVRGAKCPLDQLETVSFVEGAPCPRRGTHGVDFRDLLDRAVFDERMNAVAISHGRCSFLSVAAGDRLLRGGSIRRRRLGSYLCFRPDFRQSNTRQNRYTGLMR